MATGEISSTEDILDVRDIIARLKELENTHEDDFVNSCPDMNEHDELTAIRELLNDLAGNSVDSWYPRTLIRDSYFTDYAMELAEDIGAISNNTQWPNTCIDWDQATRELQMDYGTVMFEGVEYWYR